MENITINNFRKIKDEWSLDLAPVTFFVGPNNSGKSSVLKAFLLLEDYLKSNNHFELNFQGENHPKHKIDSFENAMNWLNQKEGKTEIHFRYTKMVGKGKIPLSIDLLFENDETHNGKLKELKIVDIQNNNKFHLNYKGALKYQLEVNGFFIPRRGGGDLSQLEATLSEDRIKVKELQERKEKLEPTDTKFVKLNEEERVLKEKIKANQKLIADLNTNITLSPEFELDKLEGSQHTLRKVLRQILSKYFQEGLDSSNHPFDQEDTFFIPIIIGDIVMDILNFNIEYLSPQRNSQTLLRMKNSQRLGVH